MLHYRLGVKKVHFVQLAVQGSIYTYWGWYWREIYAYAPLVVAQLVFAYAFDMLLSWSRRDNWVFGFGPVLIVLSTNLFLWFKDSWFLFQFVMIAGALLGKEFIKWKRNDRLVHIFNPSALSLFLVAVTILLLHATNLTRGQEIAFTFSYPPHIYLWIFLVGLLVQSLFSVTLITVSAVIALAALNVVYTYFTGSYQFGDSNIPVLTAVQFSFA